MRVLVTGGAGFIGRHLCRALVAEGHAVIAFDNLSSSSREDLPSGVLFLRGEVRREFQVQCDAIYHLACPASPVQYRQRPMMTLESATLGTLNALGCAQENDAPIVVASTSEVYGDPEIHPQREDYWGHCNPVGPRSQYSEGKRCAEAFCVAAAAESKLDVGIARICNTYGPGMRKDDGRVIPTFIEEARRGGLLEVTGDGSQTRCFCYVSDTVRGLLAMMKAIEGRSDREPQPLICNLGNPDERTILSVAEDIARRLGGRVLVTGTRAAEDPRRRCPDISRAREVLGWAPEVPFAVGLDRTIAAWLTS